MVLPDLMVLPLCTRCLAALPPAGRPWMLAFRFVFFLPSEVPSPRGLLPLFGGAFSSFSSDSDEDEDNASCIKRCAMTPGTSSGRAQFMRARAHSSVSIS